ncbi:MAG: HTTM domain-containing protein [Bacteriovoracaceae bacterium]|nr:HTTM domain-containing protein [Bacteriovoracaceae bacterium]
MVKTLYRPIDSAIFIYFRFFAGILIAQELINGLFIGKFHEYTAPSFHFSYLFFDWIKPWPYWGMVLHYGLTILGGLGVAFNIQYRISSVVLFLGYTLLFLMEQSEYINHAYLYCLISFWMMILPLDKKESTKPAWMLYVILFHMGLAYFFGGIAKLNTDWLSGRPMNIFLGHREHFPLGFIYSQEWAPLFFSYGGLLFDLLIIPLLIFRPTRLMGMILSLIFHLSNVLMFGLATFPWFSLLLTSMFFDPSWPRKIPFAAQYFPPPVQATPEVRPRSFVVLALMIYGVLHLSLPLRHWLYPGTVSWTEEGHMFSWRMMLRHKQGILSFSILDKTNHKYFTIDPREYLTDRQFKDIIGKPDLILQFAHYLRDHYQKKLDGPVSVYASSRVSLNGRVEQEMIKTETDLAQEVRSIMPYKWVLPLPTSIHLPEFMMTRKP